MSIGKLILYPGNTKSSPPLITAVIKSLQRVGLIGQPMDSDCNSFLAGDNFLQLISFMGCSPDICLTPKANTGSNFCHLTIRGPLPKPQLVWDSNCRPPRCLECKKPITDWKDGIDNVSIKCSQCGAESAAGDLNWGRGAGFGYVFIEIHNVFPGEASPVDILFNQLQQDTGVSWNYFYTGPE